MANPIGGGSQGATSELNSTSTTLLAAATFTGSGEDISGFASVTCAAKSDVAGTLYMEFSPDNTNWDSSLSFAVDAASNEVHRLSITRKYFRVRYANGATNQSYFRLQINYGYQASLTSALNSSVMQDADAITVRAISDEIVIATGLFAGYSLENKFGQNQDIDAAEDIWDGGGDYTGFPTSTLETVSVLSSSANDAAAGAGGRTLRIFGHDTNYDLQQEDITLNGTNAVVSVNTYRRIYRAYLLTAGSGTTNAGTITVRHTTTTTNVFTVIPIGYGQSEISAYTIPNGYTGYMISYRATMQDTTANTAKLAIWARENGAAVRLRRIFTVSTAYPIERRIYGGIKFIQKTDIVFRALSVANANADIAVGYDVILVKN